MDLSSVASCVVFAIHTADATCICTTKLDGFPVFCTTAYTTKYACIFMDTPLCCLLMC